MRYLSLLILFGLSLTACHNYDDEQSQANLSVLVYIASDNNLDSFISQDIRQMMEGSRNLTKQQNLILYVDRKNHPPYFLKVANGDTTRLYTFPQETKSSDATTLAMALKWVKENYNAKQYGLALWGHATGWTVTQVEDLAPNTPRRAYGLDTADSISSWMNIPDMAKALNTVCGDTLLHFIFADCCCFQSIESAYELRHCTDYIIASAAEIPGEGAPYQTVIPALFSNSDDFYKQAVDAYYEQLSYGYQESMSVVKTSELEDLAQATRSALLQCGPRMDSENASYPDVENLIYFYDRTLFDINDFMLRYCDENNYKEWKRSFDKAIVYRTVVPVWMANHVCFTDYLQREFLHFTISDERYSGVSMFVPQDPEEAYMKCLEEVWDYYRFNRASAWLRNAQQQNENISKMQWYKAAGLDQLGW